MKNIFMVSLVIILLVPCILIGCTAETVEPSPAPAPESTTTSAPTAAPTPAPTQEEEWEPPIPGMKQGEEDLYFEWTWATGNQRRTPSDPFELTAEENFFTELEKQTGGRFKVKYAYGGIAGELSEMHHLVSGGVNEMGDISLVSSAAEFPLVGMNSVFGWYTSDPVINQQLGYNINTHPLVQESMDEMNMVLGFNNVISTFKPIVSNRIGKIEEAEGFVGLRLGTGKTGEFTWAKEMEIVPVNLIAPEFYESLQKGIIDFVILDLAGALFVFHLDEVCSHIIDIDMGGGGGSWTGINKDSWNSLPQYIRDLWMELRPTYYDEYTIKLLEASEKAVLEVAKAKGLELYELPPETESKFTEAMSPVWEAWVEEQGQYPGGEYIQEFLKDQIAFRNEITDQPWTLYEPH